jgi:hypothetical protein
MGCLILITATFFLHFLVLSTHIYELTRPLNPNERKNQKIKNQHCMKEFDYIAQVVCVGGFVCYKPKSLLCWEGFWKSGQAIVTTNVHPAYNM